MLPAFIGPSKAAAAAILIEVEMMRVDLQFERIDKNRKETEEAERILFEGVKSAQHPWTSTKDVLDKLGIYLFADIHYLLISLNNIDKLLIMLEKILTGYPEIAALRKKHKQPFCEYNKFRNNLEHIYQRINDGVTELANLSDDQFTFNNESFSIGEDRRKEVRTIHADIRKALMVVAQKQAEKRREVDRSSVEGRDNTQF
jgi:hypothetical protein